MFVCVVCRLNESNANAEQQNSRVLKKLYLNDTIQHARVWEEEEEEEEEAESIYHVVHG